MKVVVNHGMDIDTEYRLSKEAMEFLNVSDCWAYNEDRSNPQLIKCIETLGDKASDFDWDCELEIVEIPDDITDYIIDDDDGYENVIYVRNGRLYSTSPYFEKYHITLHTKGEKLI